MNYHKTVISLGAGVQSTTLYLMACMGEVTPLPSEGIFADTKSEPDYVYDHLDWLKKNYSHIIPITVVSAGDLEEDTLGEREGRKKFAAIPVRVVSDDGRGTMLRRQCTREYKIAPIVRRIRESLGLRKRQRAQGKFKVEQWIGISRDEVVRMKPNRLQWLDNRWPLVEKGMSRQDCMDWLKAKGLPIPEKSACYYCPFHDDKTWAWMKESKPEIFAKAVWFDEQIRSGKLGGVTDKAYLHRALKPLSEIDFGKSGRDQLNLDFGNECEGYCGV